MLLIEVIAFVATAILGILWILIPDRNWEPWILLCSLIGVAVELFRRFGPDAAVAEVGRTYPTAAKPVYTDNSARWLADNIHSAKLSLSLPRALQWAKASGNAGLERWARLELYGYDGENGMQESDTVPSYRAVTGRWIDASGSWLDFSEYPELSIVNEFRLRFGVAKLEELAEKTVMQNLTHDASLNILRREGIDVDHFSFSPIEVRGILDAIRNKLAERFFETFPSSPH